jgi:hypothetical protein
MKTRRTLVQIGLMCAVLWQAIPLGGLLVFAVDSPYTLKSLGL